MQVEVLDDSLERMDLPLFLIQTILKLVLLFPGQVALLLQALAIKLVSLGFLVPVFTLTSLIIVVV